jgi:predicted ester cyclase
MSIETNKNTIRRMFEEVVNNDRTDLIDELFDERFMTNTPQGTMNRDGFREFVNAWRAGFADLRCEVGDLIAEGDRIAWSVRATGTHTGDFNGIPATGRSVDFLSLNVGRLTPEGRAIEHTVVMDLVGMLTQMGVIDAPAPA